MMARPRKYLRNPVIHADATLVRVFFRDVRDFRAFVLVAVT
jgi:hypothetical protein